MQGAVLALVIVGIVAIVVAIGLAAAHLWASSQMEQADEQVAFASANLASLAGELASHAADLVGRARFQDELTDGAADVATERVLALRRAVDGLEAGRGGANAMEDATDELVAVLDGMRVPPDPALVDDVREACHGLGSASKVRNELASSWVGLLAYGLRR